MSGRLRARDENIDEKKTGKIWRLMEKKEEEGKEKKRKLPLLSETRRRGVVTMWSSARDKPVPFAKGGWVKGERGATPRWVTIIRTVSHCLDFGHQWGNPFCKAGMQNLT